MGMLSEGWSIDPVQRLPSAAPSGVGGVTSWSPGEPATMVTRYLGSVYVLLTMVKFLYAASGVWTPVLAQSKSTSAGLLAAAGQDRLNWDSLSASRLPVVRFGRVGSDR